MAKLIFFRILILSIFFWATVGAFNTITHYEPNKNFLVWEFKLDYNSSTLLIRLVTPKNNTCYEPKFLFVLFRGQTYITSLWVTIELPLPPQVRYAIRH